GVKARGGFDCSGFVWRVYKLQPYPGAPALAETLRGRTTYAMSGEVPSARRIGFAKLQPGDVVFFGAKGPRSKPAEVDHAGIYAGNGWFVHSSSQGVTLTQLTGWYRQRFAWPRRRRPCVASQPSAAERSPSSEAFPSTGSGTTMTGRRRSTRLPLVVTPVCIAGAAAFVAAAVSFAGTPHSAATLGGLGALLA